MFLFISSPPYNFLSVCFWVSRENIINFFLLRENENVVPKYMYDTHTYFGWRVENIFCWHCWQWQSKDKIYYTFYPLLFYIAFFLAPSGRKKFTFWKEILGIFSHDGNRLSKNVSSIPIFLVQNFMFYQTVVKPIPIKS